MFLFKLLCSKSGEKHMVLEIKDQRRALFYQQYSQLSIWKTSQISKLKRWWEEAKKEGESSRLRTDISTSCLCRGVFSCSDWDSWVRTGEWVSTAEVRGEHVQHHSSMQRKDGGRSSGERRDRQMEQQPGSSEPLRTRAIFTHHTNADETIYSIRVFLQLYSLELMHTGCRQPGNRLARQPSALTVCEVVYEKHHRECVVLLYTFRKSGAGSVFTFKRPGGGAPLD